MTQEISNSFSWQRFGMVARFYYPRLKKQIIFYPLTSLAIFLLTIGSIHVDWIPLSLLTPLSMLSTILLWFGPAMFMYHEDHVTETSLPAKGSEKAAFIILYSAVAIPLMINLFQWVFPQSFYEAAFYLELNEKLKSELNKPELIQNISQMISDIRSNPTIIVSSFLLSVFPCIITLYMTVRGRSNRIAWSLVWIIVYIVSMGISIVIMGIIAAFSDSFHEMIKQCSNLTPGQDASNIISGMVIQATNFVFLVIGALTLVAAIVLLTCTYRTIVRRQIR